VEILHDHRERQHFPVRPGDVSRKRACTAKRPGFRAKVSFRCCSLHPAGKRPVLPRPGERVVKDGEKPLIPVHDLEQSGDASGSAQIVARDTRPICDDYPVRVERPTGQEFLHGRNPGRRRARSSRPEGPHGFQEAFRGEIVTRPVHVGDDRVQSAIYTRKRPRRGRKSIEDHSRALNPMPGEMFGKHTKCVPCRFAHCYPGGGRIPGAERAADDDGIGLLRQAASYLERPSGRVWGRGSPVFNGNVSCFGFDRNGERVAGVVASSDLHPDRIAVQREGSRGHAVRLGFIVPHPPCTPGNIIES